MLKIRVRFRWVGLYSVLLMAGVLFLNLSFFSPIAAAPGELDGIAEQAQSIVILGSSHPGKKVKSTHKAKRHEAANSAGSGTLNITLPAANPALASSHNSQLRKLAEYERTSGGAVASGMMVFTDIPASSHAAESAAADMAQTLAEFAKVDITPIVVMEPTINGDPVNFKNYRNGTYDGILNSYFNALQDRGISSKAMGLWVYFPEANIPEWGAPDPSDFAANVSRTVKLQKKYFGASKSTILLDAASYPAGSTDWDDGSYVSLSPYTKDIPDGLLDSFGLQGFPWVPPANENQADSNLDPSVFLMPKLAIDAARQLGVSDVWMNSGTFSRAYAGQHNRQVTMSADERQQILNGILDQALTVKGAGFSTAINLFSEDKSDTAEGIDWSYSSNSASDVFTDFAKKLYQKNVDLWLFDN